MNEPMRQSESEVPLQFDWFANFGRDGIRTRYRPRSRIYSVFFVVVPWFDMMIISVAFAFFTLMMSSTPGISVDLPAFAVKDGMRSTIMIVAKVSPLGVESLAESGGVDDGATVPPMGVTVFFNDSRYNLSQPHHIATFRNTLETLVLQSGETEALLYIDKDVTHENTMRLAMLLKSAGVSRICYVVKEP